MEFSIFCGMILLKNREVRSKMSEEVKNEVPTMNQTVGSEASTQATNAVGELETFDLGVDAPKEKKKLNRKGITVVILVLLVSVGAFVGYKAYKYFTKNPTKIIKEVINRTYEDFSSGLKEVKTEQGEVSILKEPIRISGTLKYNDASFVGLDRETIVYDLGLDYSKKYATGYVGLKENAKTLGDVRVYLKNDRMYMTSDTMFDNVYDLGESKFSDMFDLSSLEGDLTPVYTTEDLDYAVRGLKDALIESLDAEAMTIQDVNLDIDGEVVKTKKITYKIDKESYNKLSKTLAENILKDDKLIEKLALISSQSEDGVRSYFESVKESTSNESFDGEFSIYTTGADYKVVKVEFGDTFDMVTFTSHKDKFAFVWDVAGTKVEVEGAKTGKTVDLNVSVNGERYANLKINKFDQEGIDIDYKLMNEGLELNGNLKLTLKKTGDKKYSGEAKASIKGDMGGQKGNYALGITYDVESGKELPNVDVSKAMTEFTYEDTNKMTVQMFYLQNSAFYQYFGGEPLIPDESYGF